MTAQQPHECRCETCANNVPSEIRKGFRKCKVSNFLIEPTHTNLIEHTARAGCLSHPKSREYLNRDVIEELEQKVAHAKEGERSHDSFELEWRHERKAFEYAISLLRGEQQMGGERR